MFSIIPLQTIAAILLSVGASLLWWGTLRAPWLFLTIGILAMLGLERLLTTFWIYGQIAFGSGRFLERAPTPIEQLANPWPTTASFAVSALVVVIGFPLLFWLRKLLAVQ